MTIGAREKNRIVLRDFVELRARRKLRWFPKCFDPAAARDPFATFGLRNALLNPGEKIFERVRPFEIQFHLALADSENMAMRIGETRHDRFAAKIDDARFVTAKFSRLFV